MFRFCLFLKNGSGKYGKCCSILQDVAWSEIYGAGWRNTQRTTRERDGAHLAPSSAMIFASCHIPLIVAIKSFHAVFHLENGYALGAPISILW